MKIGTINYHNAYNYGAVFQAEALQSIIETLGYDCEIIDYHNPQVEAQYNFKPIRLDKELIKNLKANLVLLPFITKKKTNFQSWINGYKKTSYTTKEELRDLAESFDKIIVGSDQVWNMKCHGADESFFLDFARDQQKIAYAASFGTHELPQEYLSLYQRHLSAFSSISVREKRGIEIVNDLIGVKVSCTMDPVLLVGRDHWEKKASNFNLKIPYIFVYQLGHSNDVNQYVRGLRSKLKFPVVFITGHIGNMVHYRISDKNYSSASPEDFLSLIEGASYVVTNSFHATVLSLMFHKPFSVVAEGGSEAAYNSRIYSLLSSYGLESRIYSKFDAGQFEKDVCFDLYDEVIESDRKRSIEFLKESIKKK